MSSTSIEWTDVTWNPARGCSRVSEGCRNCYAEKIASRFSGKGQTFDGFADTHLFLGPGEPLNRKGGWTGKVALVLEKLDEPLRWRKPRRVFVNSMSDLFHEALPDESIAAVFGVMAAAHGHTFQILTKRPERMRRWFGWIEQGFAGAGIGGTRLAPAGPSLTANYIRSCGEWRSLKWPLPNVWLGVSVEDQATADERIPLLLQTPAAERFVSYEPALGPVDFGQLPNSGGFAEGQRYLDALKRLAWDCNADGSYVDSCAIREGLDWIIVGGESGPGARPFDVAWARSTVEQCKAAGVAVFVKQMGSNVRDRNDRFATDTPPQDPRDWPEPPGEGWHDGNHEHNPDGYREDYQGAPVRIRLPKKGGDPSRWPEDLRVREFPA